MSKSTTTGVRASGGDSSDANRAEPSGLLHGYAPRSGVYDEAVQADGTLRPPYRALFGRLDQIRSEGLKNRQQQAQSQIERDGVAFNPYDNERQFGRPWELDLVPLVIPHDEWSELSVRIAQRISVLRALLQDLSGPQHTIREGLIPPELLFGHPGWFPAYQTLPQDERSDVIYAATDVVRDADGYWRATSDRTRSPFGIGYVLENRVVTSRMLSDIFRTQPIRRLASFYVDLKERLRSLAPRHKDNPRIVIWTEGPDAHGYFEDSYLARYLGYTLAEGDDLAVRRNRVQLLTLGGTLPVEVLLRRQDDDDCDSVELNPDSARGISGLLDVVRGGRVAVANGLGSRIVESPCFLPFLNGVSRRLLGEDLRLPSVATWWCGQSRELEYVLENLEHLQIRSAYRMSDAPPIVGSRLSKTERESLVRRIRAEPSRYVGQELIRRATTPVMTDQGLRPWSYSLRSFAVSTESGEFRVMPGGLARVSPDSDSLNFTMTAGDCSQDVWVLADEKRETVSLLDPGGERLQPRRSGSDLPSRVADNLFWLGRYTERADHTARLLRTLTELLDNRDQGSSDHSEEMLVSLMAEEGLISPDHAVPELRNTVSDTHTMLLDALLDTEQPMSLISSVYATARSAGRVRDRLSHDMWRTIERLRRRYADAARSSRSDLGEILEETFAAISAFSGRVADGMTRTLGWRFLCLGRSIERCRLMATLIQRAAVRGDSPDEPDVLQTILTAADSMITYRSRYMATLQLPVVLDLLICDETNPRSVISSLQEIEEHVNALPGRADQSRLSYEQTAIIRLVAAVRTADVFQLAEKNANGRRKALQRLTADLIRVLPDLSNAVTSRYLIHAGLPRQFSRHLPSPL